MNHERPTPATGCLCTKVSFTCVESQVPPLPSSNVVERVLILEGGSFSTCRAFRGFCLDSLSLPSLPCQHILVCFARALRTATPPRDVQPCSAYARLSPKARGCRRLQACVQRPRTSPEATAAASTTSHCFVGSVPKAATQTDNAQAVTVWQVSNDNGSIREAIPG